MFTDYILTRGNSYFNSFISNCKLDEYIIEEISEHSNKITVALKKFLLQHSTLEFEEALLKELNIFNNKHFPSPDYRYKLSRGQINEEKYAREKEKQFL